VILLKIALVCTEKLPVPPIAGGAVQLYIDGIAPYLAAKHEITIFGIQYPGLPDRETVNGIKLVRVPGGNAEKYVNSLKEALDRSFDLIHVFNRPRYVLELMKVLPDSRFSLSLHNEMFHPEKISDEDSLRCINKVEFINTVSRYIADTVTARFPQAADKLRVVYSGADTAAFKPAWSPEGHRDRIALRAAYKLHDHKVILFVGRFSPKKGVHILLEAVKKVMLKAPDTALVIVGSKWYGANETDDYTRELQAKAARLPGPVVFTGFLPPDQVCRHYSMADIFVCASQWNEPLARVHYEAMAAGLPIITTNRGGNAEVVRDLGNGIVIDDYSNADKMAESILYLLRNPAKCIEMGKAGREMAERVYNWKRVAGEIFPEGFDLKTGTGIQVKPVPASIPGLAEDTKSSDENLKPAAEIKPSAENFKTSADDDTKASPQTVENSTDTDKAPAAPARDRSRFGWKRNVRLLPDYRR
jgi:spore coat protein SA